jgi:signal transduction histidine kinase
MSNSLLNPLDTLERQNEKLLKIVGSLMKRVEQGTEESDAAYAQFQRAAYLEEEVATRTKELERALDLLNESNRQLADAHRETEAARSNLANAIESVEEGFALFDAEDTLVMFNSKFGMHMPDVVDHLTPGMSFQEYIRLASQSVFLSLEPTDTPVEWELRRLKRHRDDHVMMNVQLIWNRWLQISEHRTDDGGTVVIQTNITDIMRLERQERERMLDDQAKLIRATLDHLNQGVCIFDKRKRLVGWNRRLSELVPLTFSNLRTGSHFFSMIESLKGKVDFSGGMSLQKLLSWVKTPKDRASLRFEIKGGRQTVLSVFAQEMPDTGFVISFTDISAERAAITAMREANETLEQRVLDRTLELEDALSEAERANASKSRFVAAASHDLLQPLSAAKLYISSLEVSAKSDNSRTIAGKAHRALQSVEDILEALLDISKLDSGRASIHIAPVPLNLVLNQLSDELGPIARQKGLDLRVVPTNVIVNSDATYLRRILQNLVANAVRYTKSGRVLVGARRVEGGIRVHVLDTGPGIPEDKQNEIFKEFQRINASASAAEGMGLGLAIVERACALLNHPIGLVSKVGRGTNFHVEFPLSTSRKSTQRQTRTHTSQFQQNTLQNLVVLLIENDLELQNALTITMEGWGVNVLVADSLAAAKDLLTEIDIEPDIVLADYQLNDGELGTDAISVLRKTFFGVPAAIITANRTKDVRREAQGIGVQVLYKPISPDTLKSFLLKSVTDFEIGNL